GVGRGGRARGLVGLRVADPADLAHAEGAADVRVAEIDVVQGAVGALGEVDDVSVRAVEGAVGRLEVEDTGDVAVAVQGEAPDPVLGVVGEEIAALVAARELGAVINEPASDGCVPAVVRVAVDRAGALPGAGSLRVGPA